MKWSVLAASIMMPTAFAVAGAASAQTVAGPAAPAGQETSREKPADMPPGMETMQGGTPPPSMGTMTEPTAAPRAVAGEPVTTLHNLEPQAGWPSPTADDAPYSFVLLDLLEYRESSGAGSLRWDGFGWFGGDYNRIWVKSEGTQSLRSGGGGEAEGQLLYGRLISPYFDLQAGARVATRWGNGSNRPRGYAVLGLQGLSPYRFEIEPALFLSTKGQISGRLNASYDQLLTQRLILQPRIDASFALQKDEAFGVGSGLTDVELGLRARYEFRREFAPYIGITHRRSFGSTRRILQAEGEQTRQTSIVAGVRVWF